jgi:nitrate reductase cytochrome c-type subunit
MMKKTIHPITLCIILTIFILSTTACNRKESEKQQNKQEVSKQEVIKDEAHKDMSPASLFASKCTSCHDAKQAEDMHASKESFKDLINKMIAKGAKISDKESNTISDFLATPSRFLL